MVVFLSMKFGGTRNGQTPHDATLWRSLLRWLLPLLSSSAMVIKYFWLLLLGWLVEKLKMHPEKKTHFWRASQRIFYLWFVCFRIFCILTFLFFSVTIFNKKKESDIHYNSITCCHTPGGLVLLQKYWLGGPGCLIFMKDRAAFKNQPSCWGQVSFRSYLFFQCQKQSSKCNTYNCH